MEHYEGNCNSDGPNHPPPALCGHFMFIDSYHSWDGDISLLSQQMVINDYKILTNQIFQSIIVEKQHYSVNV